MILPYKVDIRKNLRNHRALWQKGMEDDKT